jgi:crotonobetainyl-CoA:carnitine CoA-transferase CaiB-like acyl-CoA transferase
MTVRKLVYVVLLGKEMKAGRRITSRCHNPLCCSDKCLFQSSQADILLAAHARRLKDDPMSARRAQRSASRAKLSPEIAAEIMASTEGHQELAERHGVAIDTIRAVRRGATYKAPVMGANSVFTFGAQVAQAEAA